MYGGHGIISVRLWKEGWGKEYNRGKEDVILSSIRFESSFEYPDGSDDSDDSDIEDGNSDRDISGTSPITSDWEDYEIMLDGDKYTISCDFSELEANGWTICDEYANETLELDYYGEIQIEKGALTTWIVLGNMYDESEIPCNDAQVVGVIIDDELEGTSSYITGGVCYGMSYDEVIGTLGETEESYGDDEFMILTYEGSKYESDDFSCLEIILENGKVTEIDIRNW